MTPERDVDESAGEQATGEPLKLTKLMIGEMIAHAIADLPNECCGVIIGKSGSVAELRRARNEEESPFRFSIHHEDVIAIDREQRKNDWDMLVVYHSHVGTEAEPSPTDVRRSYIDLNGDPTDLFPGTRWVIISLMDITRPQVRAFDISQREVSEVEIDVLDPKARRDSSADEPPQ